MFWAAGCGGKLTCGADTKEVDGTCVSKAVANADKDLDNDGYIGSDDCNDEDALSYPGADETCDGVDNDCDGRIDEEDAVDPGTFYADIDGDGYGDGTSVTHACSAPDGMVEEGTDCDDAHPGVNPGATEIWYDGLDGDCAGDDDFDRDEDGFAGGPDGLDCDDEDPTAYPAAEEVCGDGVDNDCDGSLGDCGLNGDVGVESANLILLGREADEYAGASLAYVGDADGDGTPDLLVGSPRLDTDAGTNAGGATLVAASLTGLNHLASGHSIEGVIAGALAGTGVYGAQDLDLDGHMDLLIVVPGDRTIAPEPLEPVDTGEVTEEDTGSEPEVLLGQPWAGAVHQVTGPVVGSMSLTSTANIFRGATIGHGIGAVAVLGDQDGDDRPEIAFGLSDDGARGEGSGTVIIVQSPFSGELTDTDGFRLGAAGPGDRAGTAVISPGDINGDGIADIAISAPFAESRPPSSPYSGSEPIRVDVGAVYVLHGPLLRDAYLDDADGIYTGEADNDHVGQSLAAPGDLNGDGHNDLLIGAHEMDGSFTDSGGAYVIHGPADRSISLAGAQLRMIGGDGSERAGISVSGGGDTDGDGVREVLIGADRARGGAGAVYLLRGDLTGTVDLTEAFATFVGDEPGDWFGTAICGGTDVNDDGLDDVLIGAPGNDIAGDNAGAAYLFWGVPR